MYKKQTTREKRKRRVRRKIFGAPERPRLSVYRSLRHIYAQIIDDLNGKTLVAASSLSPEFKETTRRSGNIEAAKVVGKLIAEKAKKVNITKVRFDRGAYRYHGKVKVLAEAARENGLEF